MLGYLKILPITPLFAIKAITYLFIHSLFKAFGGGDGGLFSCI